MKTLLNLVILTLLGATAIAQVEIYADGNVGIGTSDQESVLSKISANSEGSSNVTYYFYSDKTANGSNGLLVKKEAPVSGSHRGYSIQGNVTSGTGMAYGILGSSYNGTAKSTGRSYGVKGQAGNASSGFNYGVFGTVIGSNNGAGIYGCVKGAESYSVNGQYAGFFYGNTKITGTLYVGSTSYTSDINAKNDIRDLEKGNIDKLSRLSTIKYKYKNPRALKSQTRSQSTLKTQSSDTTRLDFISEEEKEFYAKDRIGLVAQEIQDVYPELVSEDPSGTLGVDYIGMIPVLIEAIKEQQEEIDALKRELKGMKGKKYQDQ